MAIQLGELLTNTKGSKSLPLLRCEGEPVVWQSAEVQKILWQPSAYNDADAKRVPICLEPEETAARELEEIEQQVTQLLSQQSHSRTRRSSARPWRPTRWRPACRAAGRPAPAGTAS